MAKAKAQTQKLDLYKEHKSDYVAPKAPVLLEPGPAIYLAVDGQGPPGGEAFQAAIGDLYAMAYTIKMTRKCAGKGDYKVCALEGQYWLGGGGSDFTKARMDQWRWKLMVRVPTFLGEADLTDARRSLAEKGKAGGFDKVKLEQITEGRCVQMLHFGPYDAVAASYARMMEFAASQGLGPAGRSHEIYLSDPRRVPPERLRTIIRQPVAKRR